MAMPVMRISEDTWKRLQSWAIPLEDSPDDALRRVLDAAEAQRLLSTLPGVEEVRDRGTLGIHHVFQVERPFLHADANLGHDRSPACQLSSASKWTNRRMSPRATVTPSGISTRP